MHRLTNNPAYNKCPEVLFVGDVFSNLQGKDFMKELYEVVCFHIKHKLQYNSFEHTCNSFEHTYNSFEHTYNSY